MKLKQTGGRVIAFAKLRGYRALREGGGNLVSLVRQLVSRDNLATKGLPTYDDGLKNWSKEVVRAEMRVLRQNNRDIRNLMNDPNLYDTGEWRQFRKLVEGQEMHLGNLDSMVKDGVSGALTLFNETKLVVGEANALLNRNLDRLFSREAAAGLRRQRRKFTQGRKQLRDHADKVRLRR